MTSRALLRALLAPSLLAFTVAGCGGKVNPTDGDSDSGSKSDSGTTVDSGHDTGGCMPTDCGPVPPVPPPLPCPDGSIPSVTTTCERSAGVCGWRVVYGTCSGGKTCGGSSGVACAADEFCKFTTCPAPGSTGTCAKKPDGCDDIYSPVCGCNGITYGNPCSADSASAPVSHVGACDVAPPPPSMSCGGFAGTKCPVGDFCMYPDGDCLKPDYPGTCTPQPGGCPDTYDPVCGCDGKTYPNRCDASSNGISVVTKGTCGK